MKKSEFPLTPGDFVEFPSAINCIPSGVYRFIGGDDIFLQFLVGKKIMFGVTADCLPSLRKVSRREAIFKKTTTGDFVNRYYELVEILKSIDTPTRGPVTFCCLPPEEAREFDA